MRFSLVLSDFGHCLMGVQPFCLAITRTTWPEWTWAWWPPLRCFSPLLMLLSLPVWLSREPSNLSELDSDSPLWLACKFPLNFPLRFICRMGSAYIHILYTVRFSVRLLTAYSIHSHFLIISTYCHCYFWILLTSNTYKSITSYFTRFTYFYLRIGCLLWRPITTTDGIYRTNFSAWGRGGRDTLTSPFFTGCIFCA
jgi:hypothetical protein